jgi:hypothetical protein
VKLKPIAEKDGSATQDGLEQRLRAVVHGAIAALPRKLRPRVESQFQAGTVEKLTEAMAAWIDGSKMDAASFAHHFFDRAADDRAMVSLRAAALETVDAETRPQLSAASGHLATAIQAIGVDGWPRFVADAVKRAHDKATLAAIQKSRLRRQQRRLPQSRLHRQERQRRQRSQVRLQGLLLRRFHLE